MANCADGQNLSRKWVTHSESESCLRSQDILKYVLIFRDILKYMMIFRDISKYVLIFRDILKYVLIFRKTEARGQKPQPFL